MKRHSEEEFSIVPEVGVVTAKTTMQHIRLIIHKYQFRKTKKGPNSDLYHALQQSLQISYKLQNIPAVSYTVFPLNQQNSKNTLETMGPIQSVNSFSKPNLAQFNDCLNFKVFKCFLRHHRTC